MKKSSTLFIIKEKSKPEDYFLWACYRQIFKSPKPAMDQRKRHCDTGWMGVSGTAILEGSGVTRSHLTMGTPLLAISPEMPAQVQEDRSQHAA